MRLALLVALVLLLAGPLATPVSATQVAYYNMPSSVVVRGIFGIGKLMCADPAVPDVVTDTVKNGPCFDYGGHEGEIFVLRASDELWADTSLTVAVDLNGDGCVSDSCNGEDNSGNDYRVSDCGALAGILPTTNGGPAVAQVFLRGIDVLEDLRVCGATTGYVTFDMG